jgi:hypothetical protein
MKHAMIWLLLAVALSACSPEKLELQKSPCAGAAGSPCGPKRPLNGWWLHHDRPATAQLS